MSAGHPAGRRQAPRSVWGIAAWAEGWAEGGGQWWRKQRLQAAVCSWVSPGSQGLRHTWCLGFPTVAPSSAQGRTEQMKTQPLQDPELRASWSRPRKDSSVSSDWHPQCCLHPCGSRPRTRGPGKGGAPSPALGSLPPSAAENRLRSLRPFAGLCPGGRLGSAQV